MNTADNIYVICRSLVQTRKGDLTWPVYMLTCSSHVLVTVPALWPWHAPAKIKRGGHFGVLAGMPTFSGA